MTIAISGQVPGEAQNGMVELEEEWVKDRTPDPIYAVVRIERAGFKFNDAKQERQATLKLVHIEPILEVADVDQLRAILDDACASRGGTVQSEDTPLDIPEDEDEL